MPAPVTSRPDALVLGVGGTLGVAWLRGILAGLSEGAGIDFRECEYFVGSSAGSVLAAALAAGEPPRLESGAPPPEVDEVVPAAAAEQRGAAGRRATGVAGRAPLRAVGRWGGALAAPVAPAMLRMGAPGGALMRRAALRAGPRPRRRIDALDRYLRTLDVRFDGRLRIVAVDAASGRRVVFGAPGAPAADVRRAVLASCAIPWVIEPVTIGGRDYVDGGLWSPTNLDVVPAGRGTDVLCLAPTASLAAPGSLLGAYRGVTRAAAGAEALALRSRGARVRIVRPDDESARAMGANLMSSRRRDVVLRAAYRQGRRLAATG